MVVGVAIVVAGRKTVWSAGAGSGFPRRKTIKRRDGDAFPSPRPESDDPFATVRAEPRG